MTKKDSNIVLGSDNGEATPVGIPLIRGKPLASVSIDNGHQIVLLELSSGVIALSEQGTVERHEPHLVIQRSEDIVTLFTKATGKKTLPRAVDAALRRRDKLRQRRAAMKLERNADQRFWDDLAKSGVTRPEAPTPPQNQGRVSPSRSSFAAGPQSATAADWDWQADADWFCDRFGRILGSQDWCVTNVTWAWAHRSGIVVMTCMNAAFESDATMWAEHWDCSWIFDCWYHREITIPLPPRRWQRWIWDNESRAARGGGINGGWSPRIHFAIQNIPD